MTSVGRSRWYAINDYITRHGKRKPKHFVYPMFFDVIVDPELKKLPLTSKLYYIHPTPYMHELNYRVLNPAQPLDILRKQIIMARFEYWFRKITTYHLVVNAALIEAKYLVRAIRDPLSMTGTHLQWVVALLLHCAGFFLLGEMVGRRNVGGYGIVSQDWFPSNEAFRFSPVVW